MSLAAVPAPRPSPLEPRLFAAAALVLAFAFQGSRGLWETDEGRYSECAREMLATGDWLVPRLQGVPHLTKPPGTYWLIAAGLAALGRNEWGARILVGAAFAGAAWCVRFIGRRLLGDAAGARAGWCYLAMLYPFGAGNVVSTDTFLAAALLGSIACSVASEKSARPNAWHAAAAACMAAAMNIKGHAALVPWAAFHLGAWWGRCGTGGRRGLLPWWGAASAVVAGSAWYVWASLRLPGAFEHFVGHELMDRLTSSADHSPKPLWYYFGILTAGSLPWWGHVVRGARRLALRNTGRVFAAWGGLTFLFFLAIPGKMPLYVLPCAAPIALWAAAGAKDESSPLPVRGRLVAAWVAVLLAAKFTAAELEDPRDMRTLAALARSAGGPGAPPPVLLAGKDLHGFDFHLDGAVLRVAAAGIETQNATTTLAKAAAARDAAGVPWVLVVEDDENERKAVRRVLGARAQLAARTEWMSVLRIVPPAR